MFLLHLTRDSVCAGDDADAPHARDWPLPPHASWQEVLTSIAHAGYLASVAGGEATWVACVDGVPLAVLAQQWAAPRLLPAPGPALARAGQALHFAYRVQHDPGEVYDALSTR